MKNPFFRNFIWLGIIMFLSGAFSIFIWFTETHCCFYRFSSVATNIICGVFSSTVLLILLELINFIVDRKKYGYLQGKYYRILITEVNDNKERSPTDESKIKAEFDNKGKRYIEDSIYHELVYYKCNEIKYLINMRYKFHGIYQCTIEYFNDTPYAGDWRDRQIQKRLVTATLSLNRSNPYVGEGSYEYIDVNDFGKYQFKVDEQTSDKITVSYQNVIPSGLTAGYEVWERIQ